MAYSLSFDVTNYTVKSATAQDATIKYRAYENLVYVKNPVDAAFQRMHLYVPGKYYDKAGAAIVDLKRVPIFMPNTVGGYMPGVPEVPGMSVFGHGNAAFVALQKGYVVAAPGARGRSLRDAHGKHTGAAPSCIVDLKAAVRYLRHNEGEIPGDTGRIITNGTSAGGALSSLLGATGNHPDYEPYLSAIGAADERDDIFAASCYCPITNLENADAAYEWMFHGVNDYRRLDFVMKDGKARPVATEGTLTAKQRELSATLKDSFPAYLNSLGLKDLRGTALSLDEKGNGSFKELVKDYLRASAQRALDGGAELTGLEWMTIEKGVVHSIDFDKFTRFATRMKPVPAFDDLDLGTPENELFGEGGIRARHFTAFSFKHTQTGGALAPAPVVRLMNPMNYIGDTAATTARHWRIRHGVLDRDTSLAVPVILASALMNHGAGVDLEMPWAQAHGGDYDLDALFGWIGKITVSAR